MPKTRFQGSKRKIASWIADCLQPLEFETVLDAFGGTGSVAYELKRRGKTVTYNDVLAFNHQIGLALIENADRRLTCEQIEQAIRRDPDRTYARFIERTFDGIYFTNEENAWLDVVIANIASIGDRFAKALAYYALFQSALAKRPYNLFHRRNLYMREADVRRTFGNKAAWDRPFEEHFRRYAEEANRAVFDNRRQCRAINCDAAKVEGDFDLVYIDPPYTNARGASVNYRQFYHFLEGLVDIEHWPTLIDHESRHRRLKPIPDPWSSPTQLESAFERIVDRFAQSALVVSYRSDGLPTIDALTRMLARRKRSVRVHEYDRYQYALSINKRSREVLLVAT